MGFTQDGTPFATGSDTSEQAAEMLIKAPIRRVVHETIEAAGLRGLTTDEIEARLDLTHQTASARVYELRNARAIVDSGGRRATRSGRLAVVYVSARFGEVPQ